MGSWTWKSRRNVEWSRSLSQDSFCFHFRSTLIASPASVLSFPVIIYFILEFHNCSAYTFTQDRKHFSWLPLRFCRYPKGETGMTLNKFYLIPNCFPRQHYCMAICVQQQQQKTQWPRQRHLVPFVSLDLLVVTVIDIWLFRGGTNEQTMAFFCFFKYPSSPERRPPDVDV